MKIQFHEFQTNDMAAITLEDDATDYDAIVPSDWMKRYRHVMAEYQGLQDEMNEMVYGPDEPYGEMDCE